MGLRIKLRLPVYQASTLPLSYIHTSLLTFYLRQYLNKLLKMALSL